MPKLLGVLGDVGGDRDGLACSPLARQPRTVEVEYVDSIRRHIPGLQHVHLQEDSNLPLQMGYLHVARHVSAGVS